MIGRTIWIGIATVIELLKDRTITGFFLVGAFIIMGGHIVAEMAVVERLKMFIDTGMAAIFIVSFFITIMAGSNVLNREIRDREILCTLSKPIPRPVWMLGKTSGFLFTLALLIFSLALFMFFYVWLRMNIWIPEIFMGALFIYLEMIILCSYTALFSTITTQYLSIFFGILVLIIGHMVDDLRIYWSSDSAATLAMTKALYIIIPDLESFSATPVVMGGMEVPINVLFFKMLYSFAYLAIAITLSVLVVRNKEIA